MRIELEIYLEGFDEERWKQLKRCENEANRHFLTVEPVEEKLERIVKAAIREEYEKMLQKQEKEEFKGILEDISSSLRNEDY